MLDNKITSVNEFKSSSLLYEEEHIEEAAYDETSASIFQYDYIISIELHKKKIIDELSEFYSFKDHDKKVIDFIFDNEDIFIFLKQNSYYLTNLFQAKDKLHLELFQENEKWQVLFIEIQSSLNWERSNKRLNNFFRKLNELFPQISEKINIDIYPNGI